MSAERGILANAHQPAEVTVEAKPAASPFAGLLAEAGQTTEAAPRRDSSANKTSRVIRSGASTLRAYRIEEEIGEGGMAIVYKATQIALSRPVAIKELRPEFTRDPEVTARFEREASALASLESENVVRIFDFIRDVDTACIVMEYVHGIDLFDVLTHKKALSERLCTAIALQIVRGLEHAHARDIIHRDIKPSNVFMTKSGVVKLMDFGIARAPSRAELTQVGMSLGTPEYMAPEQIRGDEIDARADIFSVGVVLYEMLTGHRPWRDAPIPGQILDQPAAPISHGNEPPLPIHAIIMKCLEKDPGRRYENLSIVRGELERVFYATGYVDVVEVVRRGLVDDAETARSADLRAHAGVGRHDGRRFVHFALNVAIAGGLFLVLAYALGLVFR